MGLEASSLRAKRTPVKEVLHAVAGRVSHGGGGESGPDADKQGFFPLSEQKRPSPGLSAATTGSDPS